jgi:hypothetical protein
MKNNDRLNIALEMVGKIFKLKGGTLISEKYVMVLDAIEREMEIADSSNTMRDKIFKDEVTIVFYNLTEIEKGTEMLPYSFFKYNFVSCVTPQ